MSAREVAAEAWEGRSAEQLAVAWGAPAVHLFQELGSTNDVARRLAVAGATPGTVVLSELQTAGRGRAGRRWDSPAGAGLWFTLILAPPVAADGGALPLIVGLAAAACLDPWVAPATVGVKWPNDLLVDGRKVGGILCEAVWSGSRPVCLVAGVGLNLLQRPADLPMELRSDATSVAVAGGREPDRASIATCIIRSLLLRMEDGLTLHPAEIRAMQGRDTLQGQRVKVKEPVGGNPIAEGVAMGVADDGALLVRGAAGELRRIHSGTVRTE